MANDLQNLKNKKPRDFWKLFKQKKEQNTASHIEFSEFYNHFKTLASDIKIREDSVCEDFLTDFDHTGNNECIYD